MINKSKIITIVQSDGSLSTNLIARGLFSVFERLNKTCAVVDLRSAGNDMFWSVYQNDVKYVDDTIKVIKDINTVMLRTYLNSKKEILCIREKGADAFKSGEFEGLLKVISSIYENVIVVLRGGIFETDKNIELSDAVLLPFENDPVSFENFKNLYIRLLSLNSKVLNIIPVFFSCDWNLSLANKNEDELLRDAIRFKLNSKNIYEISSPDFLFKDKSDSFTESLYGLVSKIENINIYAVKNEFGEDSQQYQNLKEKLHKDLVEKMKEYLNESDLIKLRVIIREKTEQLLKFYNIDLALKIKNKLIKEISDDMVGLGILEDMLADNEITEIMVNGGKNIYIEKKGKLQQTDIFFRDINRLKIIIDRIVSGVGRHIDDASPIVDARLKDGSRVNAIIAPAALNGPVLTIRKFSKHKLSSADIIAYGSATEEMMDFLKKAVSLKKNILISGGTGTGKTTLLNVVSSFIGNDERIITIEDSAELQLQQEHVVRLETRVKSIEGTAEITIRQLVVNALRMRPDRIIVGECRSGEALDMLQAMNTGHDGSMTTVHSNSCRDAVARLVVMSLMAGVDLPEKSIISMIASAINVIVQIKRFPDGKRKISEICMLKKSDSENLQQYEFVPVFVYDAQDDKYKKITEVCL